MSPIRLLVPICALAAALLPIPAFAAEPVLPQAKGYQTRDSWRQPVAPFQIAEHTWYIGTEGLSALLVKTPDGAVLIDGGVQQAADMLLRNMAGLGIAPHDLKLILHSHAHGDHAGPLAAIRRATGATLVSNAESAVLLARGGSNDLHFGDQIVFPPAHADRLLQDGETVELGGVVFTAHFTPAHTPGSMSWSWTDASWSDTTGSGKPLRIAYVDSLSTPGYRLVDNPRFPHIVDAYRRGFEAVRNLPCDLLIAPHPDSVGWTPADADAPHPEPMSCVEYADSYELAFDQELAQQRGAAD